MEAKSWTRSQGQPASGSRSRCINSSSSNSTATAAPASATVGTREALAEVAQHACRSAPDQISAIGQVPAAHFEAAEITRYLTIVVRFQDIAQRHFKNALDHVASQLRLAH